MITVFMMLITGVVIAALKGHVISDTIRQLLTDLGYVVLGTGAVRKGMEVAGQVTAKWAPPSSATLSVTPNDPRQP